MVVVVLAPLAGVPVTVIVWWPRAASAAAGPPNALDVGSFLASWRHWRLAADLVLIGIFGGFFIVPLLAFVQHRSDARHLSRIIAANNVVSALFMVVAAVSGVALRLAGLSIPQLTLNR